MKETKLWHIKENLSIYSVNIKSNHTYPRPLEFESDCKKVAGIVVPSHNNVVLEKEPINFVFTTSGRFCKTEMTC